MNIHEHQAKAILKKYGAVVPDGIFSTSVDDLVKKAKSLITDKYVLKAQIHAGGRGKAGGVKILNTIEELEVSAKELLGKKLITHQTGPEGREVKRLYVEVSSNIEKEFYLSCLVDRASSKIAFISSDQGGMDIEEVAAKTPDKIITTKVDFKDEISEEDCNKIINIFSLNGSAKIEAINLIKSIYKMFISTDANMVEINPLILTKYFFSPELLIIKFTNIIDIVAVDPFNIKNKLENIYNTIFDNLFISDNNDIINNVNGFKICTVKNKLYVPYLFFNLGITITENNIKNIADIINIMPIEVELKFNPLFSFDVANNNGNKLSLPIKENLILK